MKLSCLVPGIRTANWRKLYDSIGASCTKYDWEVIFVGPYPLPDNMKGLPNALWIEDWGSPIRCQQIALLAAQGEYVTWAADDGTFVPGALDIGFSFLHGHNGITNPKIVVSGKYTEGNGDTSPMRGNDYYVLSNHDASGNMDYPKTYIMLNVGLVNRKLLYEIGGWDCSFEVCPMAYNDLAVRLQNYGCQFILQNELMFTCSHTPNREGDHAPIHDAQVYFDQPLFIKHYGKRENPRPVRTTIQLSNWLNAPDRWDRRFGAKPPHGS